MSWTSTSTATPGNGFAALDATQERRPAGRRRRRSSPRRSGGLHAYFTGSDQPSGRLPRHHLDFRPAAATSSRRRPVSTAGPTASSRHRAQSGGLDWAAVTGLLNPGRIRPARPGRRLPAATSASWPRGSSALQEGNRNAGSVLGRLPSRRIRPARRPGRPRRAQRQQRASPAGRSPGPSAPPGAAASALLSTRPNARQRNERPRRRHGGREQP